MKALCISHNADTGKHRITRKDRGTMTHDKAKRKRCDCPRCGNRRAWYTSEQNPVTGFQNVSDLVHCPQCGVVAESYTESMPL